MAKVKFLVKALDKVDNISYPASNEFVEVSDAFADRLKKHSGNGSMWEFQVGKQKVKKSKEIQDELEVKGDGDDEFEEDLNVDSENENLEQKED